MSGIIFESIDTFSLRQLSVVSKAATTDRNHGKNLNPYPMVPFLKNKNVQKAQQENTLHIFL